MMKLTILCLLVATALAMPVAENEKKEELPAPKSVVPLEAKPTEGIVPNVARAIEGAEKKIDEALPKMSEEMKKDEMKKDEMKKDEMKKDEMKKDEMKKDEMKKDDMMMKEEEKKLNLEKKVDEEKKPIEEAKKLEEEKKPELEIKSAEKHHDQAVVDNKDLIKETPLAGAVEVPAAAPGAAEVAIEPAQAKNIEEAPLIIEKKSSEPAKELPKPDEMRVTREAEEAAKKLEADKKIAGEDEKKPLDKLPADLTLKSADLTEAAKPKEEEKPKIEATVAEIQPKNVDAIPEAKSVQPLKTDIAKEQRSEDLIAGKVAGVENPVIEQRSEVIMPIAKEASVAAVEAIPVDAGKEVLAVVAEKSAKLTDEVKAEELPLPLEVKDAKAAEPLAKPELLADKKEEIIPAEKKLPVAEEKKDEKLVEKKEMSSEEKDDSSEEKKMDEKVMEKKKDEEKKDMSSEEKDDSSEEMKIKKEELIKKEAVTAELSSSPAAGAIAAAAATDAKAPAS